MQSTMSGSPSIGSRSTSTTITPPSSLNESSVDDSADGAADRIAEMDHFLKEAMKENAVLESRCDNLWTFKEDLEAKNKSLTDLVAEMEGAAQAHRSAESAVRAGLWEAVEEAKRSKDSLESRMQELEDIAAAAKTEALEMQRENEKVYAANESLAERVRVLEAAVRQGNSGGPCGQADSSIEVDAVRATASSAAAAEAEVAKLRAENEELRRAREKLEVFERALELVDGAEANDAADDNGENGAKLAEKVGGLHSQLVLEAVALRKEVAGLKKKKWVLKAVMANGGEREEKAVQRELAEMRLERRRTADSEQRPDSPGSPEDRAGSARSRSPLPV